MQSPGLVTVWHHEKREAPNNLTVQQVDIHSGAGFGLMIDRADNDCAEYRESFARQVCRRARKDGGPNGRLPVPGNIIVPPVRVLFNVPLADLHTVLPGSVK